MLDATLEIHLGRVATPTGSLSGSFKVKPSGDAYIQIFAIEPGGRSRGTILFLDQERYDALKAMIANADEVIADMKGQGRMVALTGMG